MPTTHISQRQVSWLSKALRRISRVLRATPDQQQVAAPKLEPIENVVSRAGREEADSQ
jgi:hypothetical protein